VTAVRAVARPGAPRGPRVWLLGLAVVVTGLNLRTAVTSVGPLLAELRSDLAISAELAGLLTTLPVIVFAVLGSATPAVARRLDEYRTLAASLVVMTGGLVGRALATMQDERQVVVLRAESWDMSGAERVRLATA